MVTAKNPDTCALCGYYMTNDEKYPGQRCVDPSHWQAAGQLAPRDFYTMARLMAGAGVELTQRPIKQVVLVGQI